jgi:hypothetical protein
VPVNEAKISEHLDLVGEAAEELASEITALFAAAPRWLSLREHYADDDSFATLPGVRQIGDSDEFLVVTGHDHHYFRLRPSVPNCPFHDWTVAQAAGKQSPPQQAIRSRSINPPVFFPSPGAHHCAHIAVDRTKSSPITPENRSRCGNRSGEDQEAFCEIRPFEHNLCCRTCAFVEVCEKAEVFQLPCKRPLKSRISNGVSVVRRLFTRGFRT